MESGMTSSALGKRKQQLAAREHSSDTEQQEQRAPNARADEGSDSERSSHDDDGGYRGQDDDEDDLEFKIDRKDLLIVKDGTIRVAESLDQQQFDANGEAIKASGTWTKAEHDRFLKAMETYPKGPWKAIAEMVGSRTVRQTQTHAQKYREKMARRMRGLRNRNGTLQHPSASAPQSNYAHGHASGYDYSEFALPHGTVVGHDRTAVVYHPTSAYAERHHQFPHPHQQQQQQQSFHHHHQHPPYHAHPQTQLYQLMPGMTAAPILHHSASTGRLHEPVVSSSMEFSQLSKQSISTAFLANSAYPASWDPQQQPGVAVPLVVVPPPLARGASCPLASSSSSSSSPLLQSSRATTTSTDASGTRVPRPSRRGSDGKVPDFDESMDFLMDVFAGHPSPLSGTQVAASRSASAGSSSAYRKREGRSQSHSPPQQRQ